MYVRLNRENTIVNVINITYNDYQLGGVQLKALRNVL